MQVVIITIGVLIAIIGIIKIAHKNDFSDKYEIDFEQRHRGNFINRFESDSFDFRNPID